MTEQRYCHYPVSNCCNAKIWHYQDGKNECAQCKQDVLEGHWHIEAVPA